MRRHVDYSQPAPPKPSFDFGDEKSAAAKKFRKTFADPTSPRRTRGDVDGGSGWELGWSVVVGLPWGLVVCLLYLLVFHRPHCQLAAAPLEAEVTERVQLHRGDFLVHTIDRVPKPGTRMEVVLDGREWILLAWSGSLADGTADSSCAPVVTSLPAVEAQVEGQDDFGGQIFQVASGEVGAAKLLAEVGSEILQEGVAARHPRGWLLYRSMEVEQCEEHGAGHCTDVFSIELPCAAGTREIEVAVLSPSPMDLPAPGILDVSGPGSTPKGLRAGDGATRLDGIAFNQQAAQALALDTWELVATAVGGAVTLDDAVRPHLSSSMTGIQEVHEGEHGLVAHGSLVGMRLLLVHLMYKHRRLTAGEDMVALSLNGRRKGKAQPGLPDTRADSVMIPIKVSIACDAHESQVSGSGLIKGKPLVYVDILVQCYDTTGVVRTSGGDNVTLVVRSGNAFEQRLLAQDNQDGTYVVHFIRPNAAYDVELVVNGQLHDKGPYFITPDKLPAVRPVEDLITPTRVVATTQGQHRVDPRWVQAQQAAQAMGRKGMGTPELPIDSPARRDYNKYLERLQSLKDSGQYETSTGEAAPNSRGHEHDVDEGAFGFGALDTKN